MTNLKEAYEKHYSDKPLDKEWMDLAGRYKADNLLTVTSGHLKSIPTFIEVGAGDGGVLESLSQRLPRETKLYAIDVSESALDILRSRPIDNLVEAQAFDGYEIPYRDKAFDVAACLHVLEHVEYPRMLLRELRRISRFQVLEIPLDFSVGVDKRVNEFLAYGHINIFTPSTFRFLLRTEGFEILAERLTKPTMEVLMCDWYHNRKLKRSFLRELRARLRPVTLPAKKLIMGRERYEEFTYSSYTCLARGTGELKIHQ